MHVVMLSLMVALLVCVLLLAAFAAFTRTPWGRRIGQAEQQRRPRLG